MQLLEKHLRLLRQAVAPIVLQHRYGSWAFAGTECRTLASVCKRTSLPRK